MTDLPSNLMNVAYLRPAAQSSTSDEYAASNAVDGDRNGKVKEKSCSQTKKTNKPWWRVDLGKSVWVEKVLIANQRDPLYEKLKDVDIRIGKTPYDFRRGSIKYPLPPLPPLLRPHPSLPPLTISYSMRAHGIIVNYFLLFLRTKKGDH